MCIVNLKTAVVKLLIGFCCCSFYAQAEPLSFSISGNAAILMNADTGAILYANNAYTPLYPASTTKIATALYTLKFHRDELNTVITAEQDSLASITPEAKIKSNFKLPSHWLETDASHMGIKKGEQMTLKDLLAGMMIVSADDASNVIAQYLGKSVPEYVNKINLYIKSIGCLNTHFLNPHGLHHPDHISTAFDLAKMTQEALKDPLFCEIVLQPRFVRPKTNKQASVSLLQTNRLVRPGSLYYPKAIGVKTGSHSKSKSTFVGAARSNGRTLILVMLGYANKKSLFEEARDLFETAFNQPKIHRVLLAAGNQPFDLPISNGSHPVKAYLKEEIALDYYPAEDPQVKCILNWKPLTMPIQEDQIVADIDVLAANGELIMRVPLHARETIEWSWPYNWITMLPSVLLGSWLSVFLSTFFAIIAIGGVYFLFR